MARVPRHLPPSRLRTVLVGLVLLSASLAWPEEPAPTSTPSEAQRQTIRRLEAIGYLAGTAKAPGESGVTIHDRGKAFQGLNLYVSGHGPEAILMDMDGKVLHRWSKSAQEIWPDLEITSPKRTSQFYRRVHLFENGDLLVIIDGIGIAKLDKDGNVLWKNQNQAHHDLDVMPNGDIYVLTRTAHMMPRLSEKAPILEDFIVVLDSQGNEKKRVSLIEAFEKSKQFREMLKGRRKRVLDTFHTNSVEVLRGDIADRVPAFQKGRILTSIRYLDAIAVVDLESGEVVWAHRGTYREQHDPEILENGHLLLFDNLGLPRASRILEFEPATMKTVWTYTGSEKAPFFSRHSGAAQRLPNGDTLIAESTSGRAFEVTPEGEIVWQFLNPGRVEGKSELIAQLPEMIRLPPDYPVSWAKGSAGKEGARRAAE